MTTNSKDAGEGVANLIDNLMNAVLRRASWNGWTSPQANRQKAIEEAACLVAERALLDRIAALEAVEKERDEAREAAGNFWTAVARAEANLAQLEAENARLRELRALAEAVVWFDWSGNDEDAVASIDHLRAALSNRTGGEA